MSPPLSREPLLNFPEVPPGYRCPERKVFPSPGRSNLWCYLSEKGEIVPIGGMQFKMEIKLVKALNQPKCKEISAAIKDSGLKVKSSIQGDSVRVASKDKDELQAIISFLREKEDSLEVALSFQNYR